MKEITFNSTDKCFYIGNEKQNKDYNTIILCIDYSQRDNCVNYYEENITCSFTFKVIQNGLIYTGYSYIEADRCDGSCGCKLEYYDEYLNEEKLNHIIFYSTCSNPNEILEVLSMQEPFENDNNPEEFKSIKLENNSLLLNDTVIKTIFEDKPKIFDLCYWFNSKPFDKFPDT